MNPEMLPFLFELEVGSLRFIGNSATDLLRPGDIELLRGVALRKQAHSMNFRVA